jgi:hypothetical protein
MQPKSDRFVASCLLLGGAAALASHAITAAMGPTAMANWQLQLGAAYGTSNIIVGALLFREQRHGPTLALAALSLQLVAITVVPTFRYVALAGPQVMLFGSDAAAGVQFGIGGTFIAIPFARDGTLTSFGAALNFDIGFAPRPLHKASFTLGINLAAGYLMHRLFRKPKLVAAAPAPHVPKEPEVPNGPWPPLNWP